MNNEGFYGRQVLDELIFLTHHQSELFKEGLFLFKRNVSQDVRFATGGMKNSGKHFERRCFAGSVRPQKSDEFAGIHGEMDVLYGLRVLFFPIKKGLQRS